jgi:hypothetical protein
MSDRVLYNSRPLSKIGRILRLSFGILTRKTWRAFPPTSHVRNVQRRRKFKRAVKILCGSTGIAIVWQRRRKQGGMTAPLFTEAEVMRKIIQFSDAVERGDQSDFAKLSTTSN